MKRSLLPNFPPMNLLARLPLMAKLFWLQVLSDSMPALLFWIGTSQNVHRVLFLG
jgi:hypothetical protein